MLCILIIFLLNFWLILTLWPLLLAMCDLRDKRFLIFYILPASAYIFSGIKNMACLHKRLLRNQLFLVIARGMLCYAMTFSFVLVVRVALIYIFVCRRYLKLEETIILQNYFRIRRIVFIVFISSFNCLCIILYMTFVSCSPEFRFWLQLTGKGNHNFSHSIENYRLFFLYKNNTFLVTIWFLIQWNDVHYRFIICWSLFSCSS